ncbi:MAG TPA: methyl-accepting chemotaxis protein [Myxococcales bacterium]|jgi:methyl-accepting chemotaxis protein
MENANETKPAAAKPKKGRAAKTSNGDAPLAPAGALNDVLAAAAKGNLSGRVDPRRYQNQPELAQAAELLNAMLENTETRLAASRRREESLANSIDHAIVSLVQLVESGNLAGWEAAAPDNPALRPLVEGIGRVVGTLKTFVKEMSEAALRLSSSAHEVLAASTQHESASTEQAAAIHETTATMEELKHASAQIAENAGAVARVAEETLGAARSGKDAISEFVVAMQQIRSDGMAVVESIAKLSKRVERIGTVVDVIDEIADRSDLLALNAALEGSRAGEAGRGFSIVAAEMRRLAENVMDSTKEIKNLIAEIREATQAAATAADASRKATEEGERLGSVASGSVEGILSGVQETSDAARVINLATQQQRTATEQVVASMGEIEEVTRQTTQASKQATGASTELTQLASRLAELIKRFHVE